MQYNPTNTASRFTTKLNEMVELDGNWEVGLVEISMPKAVENVNSDDYYYVAYLTANNHPETVERVVLPQGNYSKVKDVLYALQHEQRKVFHLRTVNDIPIVIRYGSQSKRVSVKILAKPNTVIFGVQFSAALAEMLGFNQYAIYDGHQEHRAYNPVDMHLNYNLMYVYCDLLEQILVGDTKATLLRIVNRSSSDHVLDGIGHTTFDPITYVPLQKKFFDTVEIQLMTDLGQPMPFVDGKSIVMLEFRRAAHPYLLL